MKNKLPLINVIRNPFRTACVAAMTALLSFSLSGGSALVKSFQNGLESTSDRLGADLIVIPEGSDKSVQDILLQGATGYFYMDSSVYDLVSHTEGVESATAQFYLTSLNASCCSVKVEIIGYDPGSDFVVSPWIQSQFPELKDNITPNDDSREIIAGSNVLVDNGAIELYGHRFNVKAQLSETGTGLDNAVFADMGTINKLMDYALEKSFVFPDETKPKESISAILVKISDGYDADDVEKRIRKSIDGVDVVSSAGMISNISDGLSLISSMLTFVCIAFFVISFAVLVILFGLSATEREKEFAVVRMLGLIPGRQKKQYFTEAFIQSLLGSIPGAVIALTLVLIYGNAIKINTDIPYMTVSGPELLIIFLGTAIITAITGPVAAALWIGRIDRADPAVILRRD